jgi:hypothetical protein
MHIFKRVSNLCEHYAAFFFRTPDLRPAFAGLFTKPEVLFFSSNDSDQSSRRTVRGRRRRPGSEAQPGGRAEAPRRERREQPPSGPPPSSQPPRPPSSRPSGGFTPGAGGGGMRIGGLGLGVILLLVICIGGYLLFSGGLSGSEIGDVGSLDTGSVEGFPVETEEPYFGEDVQYAEPTLVSDYFQGLNVPSGSSSTTPGQNWTVIIYQDADDKILEKDIYIDLNEAELVGSSERVNVVAQIDRYRGGYQGDGNWTTAKRFYLTADNDLEQIRSRELMDLGEVNMGDTETLIDFVTWAVENYPADKYVLILSDHGLGWPGGWTDKEPRAGVPGGVPLAQTIGPAMYLMDLDKALGEIRAQTGIEAFEIIGLDACLMGHMEVFTALTPHARYAVASQEVEPSVGWAYAAFLNELVRNPDMGGDELSRIIVDSYIEGDQRIQNAQARADFAGRGLFSPSAEQVVAQLEQGVTLSAADLSQMPGLVDSFNEYAYSLQSVDQQLVAQARNYAQHFTSIFGERVPPSYIDLANFASIIEQESGDPDIRDSTQDLFQAIQSVVIAEKSGSKKQGANGISIYFPSSQLFGNPAAGPQSYVRVAERFSGVTVWDEFLNYHYTGRPFQVEAGALSVPDRAVTAPGLGAISISEINLDGEYAAPDEPVLIRADIDGDNIGYIYLFAGYLDREANSINVIDSDFIESEDTREVNGVFYPDWGQGAFTLEFEWEPLVFAVKDGEQSILILLQPTTYGETPEEAVYKVDGLYTYADGEQRDASMYFSDGIMTQVFGYDSSGAPREILPVQGDQFTIREQWLDLDSSGRVIDQASEDGGTLVFGETPLTWELLYAPEGKYVIGFIVEDLDGNRTESYAGIEVR